MSERLIDYDYSFPAELIALQPASQRDHSRLMLVNRKQKSWQHKMFSEVSAHFQAGDVLVLNNSKVFSCRLVTERASGGKQEIFLLNRVASQTIDANGQTTETWNVLLGPNAKVKAYDTFTFENLQIKILNEGAQRLAELHFTGNLFTILEQIGHVPLPPYIHRADTKNDQTAYQTVYARHMGSVAAPTAGLHFTESLLQNLKDKGVMICPVTLHVGLGTFLPVKNENILQHTMHEENFSIDPQVWQNILAAKKENRRITAVGTTSVRVLETLAQNQSAKTSTNIFIHPPYEFQIVDRLITNFHQPKSTLLMLVSAFAGREFILSAYHEAIRQKYRLFSYGDAMMIE